MTDTAQDGYRFFDWEDRLVRRSHGGAGKPQVLGKDGAWRYFTDFRFDLIEPVDEKTAAEMAGGEEALNAPDPEQGEPKADEATEQGAEANDD